MENVSANGFFISPLPKSPAKPSLPSDLEDGSLDSPKPELPTVSIAFFPRIIKIIDKYVEIFRLSYFLGLFSCSLLFVFPKLEALASPDPVDSPSLADLERRKRQLLAELDDSSQPSPPTTPVTSRSGSSTSHSSSLDQPETQKASADDTPPATVEAMCSLTTPSPGMVKSVDLGTPLLESTSPYSKLPSVEKFAKDVCDIMHFENLPDSTGKYEQMTGILQKVRTTLAMNQQE